MTWKALIGLTLLAGCSEASQPPSSAPGSGGGSEPTQDRRVGELLFSIEGDTFVTTALNREGDLFIAELATDDKALNAEGCGMRRSTLQRISPAGRELWRIPSTEATRGEAVAPCSEHILLGSYRTAEDDVSEDTEFIEVRAQSDGEVIKRQEGSLSRSLSLSCSEVLVAGSSSSDGKFLNLRLGAEELVLARVSLPSLEAQRIVSPVANAAAAIPVDEPPGFVVAHRGGDDTTTVLRIDLAGRVLWERQVAGYSGLVPGGYTQLTASEREYVTSVLSPEGETWLTLESSDVTSTSLGPRSMGMTALRVPPDTDESTPTPLVASLFAMDQGVEIEWSQSGATTTSAGVEFGALGTDRFVINGGALYADRRNPVGGGGVDCGSVTFGADQSWTCPTCTCICRTSRLFVFAR